MLFRESWLYEWVERKINTHDLAEKLTNSGSEVESIKPLAATINSELVLGRIDNIIEHPKYKHLKICSIKVQANSKLLTIVCGAANVAVGFVGVVIKAGCNWNGKKLQKREFSGVISEGILLSSQELKLNTAYSAGIILLPKNTSLKEPVDKILQFADNILDVAVAPNRGDCLSVLGMAREIGAVTGGTFVVKKIPSVKGNNEEVINVNVNAKQACPIYCGRVITDINNTLQTPWWLIARLESSGIRAISPIVDILNYVMLEIGQPMHAFAKDSLVGDITVRFAKNNEQLTLLNDTQLKLSSKTLIIADSQQPIALAGIMGDKKHSVTNNTQHIFIESAWFESVQIRLTARQFNLNTDSSYRFERGIGPELASLAIERATALILEITGGKAGPVVTIKNESALPNINIIIFRKKRFLKLIGIAITNEQLTTILQSLGMEVLPLENECWKVTVPSYRLDVQREVDLIEELIRIIGFNKVPVKLPKATLQSAMLSEEKITCKDIKQYLASFGYQEIITYSFISAKLATICQPNLIPLSLKNPISRDMGVMRTSLWPGLLKTVQYNQRRQKTHIKLFEIGKTFTGTLDNLQQVERCAGVIAGINSNEQWAMEVKNVDFFDIKGDIERLFKLTHNIAKEQLAWQSAVHPALHPGQSSQLVLNNKTIGWLGMLHPKALAELSLQDPVAIFEFDLVAWQLRQAIKFTNWSRYPSIRRDLALLVNEQQSYQELLAVIRNSLGDILEKIWVFDIYHGPAVPEGKKSLNLALILRDKERTLLYEEVNKYFEEILSVLEKFGVELRI